MIVLHLVDGPGEPGNWLRFTDDATSGIRIEICEEKNGELVQAQFLFTLDEAKALIAAMQLAVREGESSF